MWFLGNCLVLADNDATDGAIVLRPGRFKAGT